MRTKASRACITLTHVNMAYAFHHSLAASFGLAGAKTCHATYRNTDGIAAVSPALCGLDDHLAREPVELRLVSRRRRLIFTPHLCPRGASDMDGAASAHSNVVVHSQTVQNIRQVNDASAENTPWCRGRTTSTGTVLCVSTLTVSLPGTIAETPRRPCEAMTIRSHDFRAAVSMMAR